MPNVTIVKEFTLTHNDGTQETFPIGSYDLPDDLASHWYVQAHSDNPPKVRAAAGSQAFDMRRQQAAGAQSLEDEQEAQVVAQASADARKKFRDARVRQPRPRVRDEQVEGEEENA